MSIQECDALRPCRFGCAAWCEHFSGPRVSLSAESNNSRKAPHHHSAADTVLNSERCALIPPCLNWYTLEAFLNKSRTTRPIDPKVSPSSRKLCLLEDRISNVRTVDCTGAQSVREHTAEDSVVNHDGRNGIVVVREAPDEQDLHDRLIQEVSIVLSTSMTSADAQNGLQGQTSTKESCQCVERNEILLRITDAEPG